jgi:excisionase family DNA binding protein
METQLLDILEASRIAGCGRTTGYAMVMSGQWPSVKIGRSLRVPRSGLQAWLEEREKEAEQRAAQFRAEAFPVGGGRRRG